MDHRRGFRPNNDIRDEMAQQLAMPKPGELAALREDAVEDILNGHYELAAVRYNLLIAAALMAADTDTVIEAKLRLAGVTHKLGDDDAARGFMMEALSLQVASGSSFDVEAFLKAEQERWE